MSRRRFGFHPMLIACAFFIAQGACLHAQAGATGVTSLAHQFEGQGYKPLLSPTARIELGGLLIPGHEVVGTALRAQTLAAIKPWQRRDASLVLSAPTDMGTLGHFVATLAPRDARFIGETGACANQHLRLQNFRAHSAHSTEQQRPEDPDVFAAIAGRLNVPRADLEGAVVVWSVVAADIKLPTCADSARRRLLERRLGQLVWAYKAGLPSELQGAVGNRPKLDLLQLFELNGLAKNRTVRVKGIETTPQNARISYVGRLQTLGRDPAIMADDDYNQLGDAPVGPVDLWAGRFYFRIQRGKAAPAIQTRDITLADRDRLLRLSTRRSPIR